MKILFTGDTFLKSPKTPVIGDKLRVIAEECAVRSCNFEGPIRSSGNPIKKAGPHIQQHPDAVNILLKEGFNFYNLGNNHIFDYGERGLKKTLAELRGTTCVGAAPSLEQALEPVFIRNRITVGFFSVCEASFSTATQAGHAGAAWINHPTLEERVGQASESADAIVLQAHAGVEGVHVPLPEWRSRYKELIDAGADAIIGHHPHVPQGWEMYDGKPIFYSLGHFLFESERNDQYWNSGLAVVLEVDKEGYVNHRIIPIRVKGGIVDVTQSVEYSQALNSWCRLLAQENYQQMVDDMAVRLFSDRYENYYLLSMNGMSDSTTVKQVAYNCLLYVLSKLKITQMDIDKTLLWHNLSKESHLWITQRALDQAQRRNQEYDR